MSPEWIYELERQSIFGFVVQAITEEYLQGEVLDFGCGKQPYRAIVEGNGGIYTGYDRCQFPGYVGEEGASTGPDMPLAQSWSAILCTQVCQYLPHPLDVFKRMAECLAKSNGLSYLVMTGPTNWPVKEAADLHRWTPNGIARDLNDVGFEVLFLQERPTWEGFLLGWGVIASG